MKKVLFFLVLVLLLVLSTGAMAGTCQVDAYGCYVIDENSHQSYIMFWSEAARKYIMGDLSEPYTAVVDKPAGVTDVMDLGPVELSFTCLDILSLLDDPQLDGISSEEACRVALDDGSFCYPCISQCLFMGESYSYCSSLCAWACN